MQRERAQQLTDLFKREGYQALVVRMPQYVVMLTGYVPILGNTFCIVSLDKDGTPQTRLAIPKAEEDLLPPDIAVGVKPYAEETMEYITDTLSAVHPVLRELFIDAQLENNVTIGYEGVRVLAIPAYTQVGVPGPATLDLLRELLPGARFHDASTDLLELSAIKTEHDLEQIRRCEAVALAGFEAAKAAIHVGATEAEVAGAAHAALLRAGYAAPGAWHVTPHVHVMAGHRSAQAYKAMNLTGNLAIRRGDPVLVQMEVGINGYWAELTRTFFAGEVSDEWRHIFDVCKQAHDAALGVIHAGVSGKEADAAARNVLKDAGFGKEFKHGLGHGFGFQAISHNTPPVLHPASQSVLRAGMVHNMEPAVYLEGKGGFRLNDDVAVREDGSEVLSKDLPQDLNWYVTEE